MFGWARLVTALLFVIGQILISLYLANAGVGSAYGAAGSAIIFLIWIYYSAQILFFGAEFTQVYARRHGEQILPADNAISVRDHQAEAAPAVGRTGQPATRDAVRVRVRQPEVKPWNVKERGELIIRPLPEPPRGLLPCSRLAFLTVAGWVFAVYRLVLGQKKRTLTGSDGLM
jgi:hypothetical protein